MLLFQATTHTHTQLRAFLRSKVSSQVDECVGCWYIRQFCEFLFSPKFSFSISFALTLSQFSRSLAAHSVARGLKRKKPKWFEDDAERWQPDLTRCGSDYIISCNHRRCWTGEVLLLYKTGTSLVQLVVEMAPNFLYNSPHTHTFHSQKRSRTLFGLRAIWRWWP